MNWPPRAGSQIQQIGGQFVYVIKNPPLKHSCKEWGGAEGDGECSVKHSGFRKVWEYLG